MAGTRSKVVKMSERLMAFNCPSCGETNPIKGEPEQFKNRVFACEGCGENVLLEDHIDCTATEGKADG